jgi:hypothetical protein
VKNDAICFSTACSRVNVVIRKGDEYRQYLEETGNFVLFIRRFAKGNPEGV